MRKALLSLILTLSLAAAEPRAGELTETVATLTDPTQTYTLYLPKSYDAAKKHPILFVFDPRGRGTIAAEIFREAAAAHGWILISSNDTRSDEDGSANERAVRALLPEGRRYAADPQRVYAAGFSGTALFAWAVGINTGLFQGVIGVGGRLVDVVPPSRFNFAHYGFAGETDFNNREMREIDTLLERAGKTHRLETFDGDHRWIGAEEARDALEWFEALAMKNGRRGRDEVLVASWYSRDLAGAEELERSGNPVAALRRYRSLVRTYDGLTNIDVATASVKRLEGGKVQQAALRDQQKWDDYEARFAREVFSSVGSIYARARQEGRPLTSSRLASDLRVSELERHARAAGAEGLAGRRLLEAIYAQTSFLLPRQFLAKKEHAFAAATLGVATSIHPDRWPPWYNLGAVEAQAGRAKAALAALQRAVDTGFTDAAMLLRDPDFHSLHEDRRFQEIVHRLRQDAAEPPPANPPTP